ncbi:MAG: hypothetical protein O2962_07890, partial [Cyanobacteria bacterium]|nr:hypothetical protein [Cyanobacteriota bacterium]
MTSRKTLWAQVFSTSSVVAENILIKFILDKRYDVYMLDLQINGLATEDFSCNFWQAPEDASINSLNDYLNKKGVEQYLATIITSSYDSFVTNLKRIQNYSNKFANENLLGVHIEGGLITRLGVHPPEHATALNYKEAKSLIADFPGLIKLWTICPKLDPQGEVTRLAQDNGILVSYGHSNASYNEAQRAFENYGVNLVTHWGNAMYIMNDFEQRDCSDLDLSRLDTEIDGGIGLAAYQNPNIYCMAIAGSKKDGDEHIDPRLLKKLFAKKKDKMILVSDSVVLRPEINNLQGGLVSLAKHAQNAIAIGIPEAAVKQACNETPKKLLKLGVI